MNPRKKQSASPSTVTRARAYARRIRTAQEAGIDVTNQGTMVDVTVPVTDIPVAPVNEINMDLTAPGIVTALPEVDNTVPMDVVARRHRNAVAARGNAFARRNRRFAQDAAPTVTVDVTEPVVDVPVAPVNEVVLAPAPVVIDEGVQVPESTVAPEYAVNAKLVTAYKLAELRKSLGLESKSADVHQLASKFARTMSIAEINSMARGLSEVKNASAIHTPSKPPVRSASRVSIGKVSSKTSTADFVESLFL